MIVERLVRSEAYRFAATAPSRSVSDRALVECSRTPIDHFDQVTRLSTAARLRDRFIEVPRDLQPLVPERQFDLIKTPGIASGPKGKLINFFGAAWGVLERAGVHIRHKWYFENVPGEPWLARSAGPQSEANIREWINNGVTAAINLCIEKQNFSELARAAGLKTLELGSIDNTVRRRIFSSRETQYAEMDRMMLTGIDFVRNNEKTVGHCEDGTGRTGVFIACTMMALGGKTVDEAIAYAVDVARRRGRFKSILMVPAQIRYIRHFANQLFAGKFAGYPVVPRQTGLRLAM